MIPFGIRHLCKLWFRQWLVTCSLKHVDLLSIQPEGTNFYQAITLTNVDLSSVRSSDNHLMINLEEIPQPSITKITFPKFYSNLPGANKWPQHSLFLSWNEVIAMKLCTSHDSCAVMACAKFCSSMIPYYGFKLKPILHGIWIAMEKLFMKWVPNSHGKCSSWGNWHDPIDMCWHGTKAT